jgi:hypothetical protein
LFDLGLHENEKLIRTKWRKLLNCSCFLFENNFS